MAIQNNKTLTEKAGAAAKAAMQRGRYNEPGANGRDVYGSKEKVAKHVAGIKEKAGGIK